MAILTLFYKLGEKLPLAVLVSYPKPIFFELLALQTFWLTSSLLCGLSSFKCSQDIPSCAYLCFLDVRVYFLSQGLFVRWHLYGLFLSDAIFLQYILLLHFPNRPLTFWQKISENFCVHHLPPTPVDIIVKNCIVDNQLATMLRCFQVGCLAQTEHEMSGGWREVVAHVGEQCSVLTTEVAHVGEHPK